MKPSPKVAHKEKEVTLTDKQKIAALESEVLRLHRKIAKDYASNVSARNQVRALQEQIEESYRPTPGADKLLKESAADLLKHIRT